MNYSTYSYNIDRFGNVLLCLNDKEVYLQGDNGIIARREINRARTTMTGKKHKASIDLIYQYIKEYF